MFPIDKPIVVLIGPTAIGKTALSIELAKQFNFEIISIDSMQVYRYMDIGTAKISREEMDGVPHHLIDVVDPDAPFDAGKFEKLALIAMEDIHARGKHVLLTGGTGLYLQAVLSGLSQKLPHFPEVRTELHQKLASSNPVVMHEHLETVDCISAKRLHPNDTKRVVRALEIFHGTGKTWSAHIEEHKSEAQSRFTNVLKIGLTCDRRKLYQKIEKRTHIMLDNGLKAEVEELLEGGFSRDLKSMQSIGYRHMTHYLFGEWNRATMIEKLVRDTRRYAKRQFTWFNKEEALTWVEKEAVDSIPLMVHEHIINYTTP